VNKEDITYLDHIFKAIAKIDKYLKKTNYNRFMKEDIIQDAIIRRLEIIGEATKQLSEDFKKENVKIPWKDIAGMRDKLIHKYFTVDLEEVWNTAKKDISILKREIEKILTKS